jgi:hypothetical protein
MVYAVVLVALLVLSACGTQSLVNSSVAEWRTKKVAKLMYLPPEFRIYEVPLGGKEERVVSWEKQASQYFTDTMEGIGVLHPDVQMISTNTLNLELTKLVAQHYALFCTMVPQIMLVKSDVIPALSSKRQQFGYTLGPGLAALEAATGAQLLVFAVGQDRIRSTQRRVFDSVLNLNIITMGRKAQTGTLVVSVIDVKTGDIVWLDNAFTSSMSFNDAVDMNAITHEVLGGFFKSIGQTL